MSEQNLLDEFYPSMKEEPAESGQSEVVEEEETSEAEDAGEEVEETTETAETEDTDEEEGSEPSEEVIIDGKPEKVTKAELVKGYQRQADYTRKTQAVAEERKTLEAARTKFEESVKALGEIESEVQALVMGDLSSINWDELRDTDASEYLRMREVVQKRESALKDISEKRAKLEADQIAKEQVALQKALEWDNAETGTTKREADLKLVQEHFGNSPALQKAKDAETVLAFVEAAKYRQLQKEKAEVKRELKKVPKVSKPAKSTTKASESNWLDSFYK
jgi:hypothetical protein